MRPSKKIYFGLLDREKYLNVGDILIEADGIFIKIEDMPDSYLKEIYGYTKEELYAVIEEQLYLDIDEF